MTIDDVLSVVIWLSAGVYTAAYLTLIPELSEAETKIGGILAALLLTFAAVVTAL